MKKNTRGSGTSEDSQLVYYNKQPLTVVRAILGVSEDPNVGIVIGFIGPSTGVVGTKDIDIFINFKERRAGKYELDDDHTASVAIGTWLYIGPGVPPFMFTGFFRAKSGILNITSYNDIGLIYQVEGDCNFMADVEGKQVEVTAQFKLSAGKPPLV